MKGRIFVCKSFTFASYEVEDILQLAEELKKDAQLFSIENHGDFSTIWIKKRVKNDPKTMV